MLVLHKGLLAFILPLGFLGFPFSPLSVTLIYGIAHCQRSPFSDIPTTFTLVPLAVFVLRYFRSHLEKIYLSCPSMLNYPDFCKLKVAEGVCFQSVFKTHSF